MMMTITTTKKNGLVQIGFLLLLFCAVTQVNSYSKYGRGCADIGCTPRETCVLVQDSCNYGQREGKECGSYPTCKRNPNADSARIPGSILNSGPDNTFYSQPSYPTLNTNIIYNNPNQNNPNHPNNHLNNQNNQQNQNQNQNQNINHRPQNINPNINQNNPNQYPPQNTNMIFGSPQNQPPQINSNIPIFPYNQPTSAPPFQQFPQAQHPASVPHVSQQNVPGAPPYIFGNQPSYFNPQAATTKEPSSLFEHLYNKQDRQRHNSNSAKQIIDLKNMQYLISINFILILTFGLFYCQSINSL